MYICMCVTLLPQQSYCVGGPHQQRGLLSKLHFTKLQKTLPTFAFELDLI